MNVFISHAHEQQDLAKAWKVLLGAIAPKSVKVWYSSDRDPLGGVGAGRWRDKLGTELDTAELVLALCTPESASKPWLMFECATAMSRSTAKTVIPVLYYMNEDELPSPLADLQCYRGDLEDGVAALCAKEVLRKKLTRPLLKRVREYLQRVELNRQARDGRPFLRDEFHAFRTARQLEGRWFAKWTKPDDSGVQTDWVQDSMELTTTKERLAAVGKTERGLFYPMEGIVSSRGHVALVYWSRGSIPICGTVLLEITIGRGDFMEGVWQGYDGTIDERLALIGGHVALGRDLARVKKWSPTAKR